MKHFAIGALILMTVSLSTAQESDYNFRDSNRPQFINFTSVSELKKAQESAQVTVIDVRLKEDFDSDPMLIPGAIYMNPENIAQWATKLDKNDEVIVYCVAGKWVSQKAADYLSGAGIVVTSLAGGINAWKEDNK